MSQELDQLFSGFQGLKVLIVGDVMVDKYIFGRVNRMSPEAPVPVVDADNFDARLGGAGNVALNVHAMGGIPILCSVIGKDAEADDLRELIRKAGLTDRAIVYSQKRKTTTKTRIIGNNKQIVRIDHEITSDLDALDTYYLEEHYNRELEQADVVIMEDYNKGVLHGLNIPKLIDKARKAGVPVVVDPKKQNFEAYKGCTLFKPNLKEIREGMGIDINPADTESLIAAVSKLEERLENEISLLTLSEHGVYIHSKHESHRLPAHIRNIADVSGAGDTVISVAAMCLAMKTPLRLLAELSNLAGGLVCEHTGVVPVNPANLLQEAKALTLK
ncbi:MAG: bifunctional heptose 7-phosphate kinase/heptose 1-phosphate adenyltransferase [Sphingomonadales bacterium]|jgi:rfaE bifunctional protein kinase chain/domain